MPAGSEYRKVRDLLPYKDLQAAARKDQSVPRHNRTVKHTDQLLHRRTAEPHTDPEQAGTEAEQVLDTAVGTASDPAPGTAADTVSERAQRVADTAALPEPDTAEEHCKQTMYTAAREPDMQVPEGKIPHNSSRV